MKKKIVLGIALFIITVIIVFLIKNSLNTTFPKKLENIPKEAVWRGGADGGFWFYFVTQETDSSSRLKVYNEYNGKLILDSNFFTTGNCKLPKGNAILDSINYFDFKNIVLLNGCKLTAQKPMQISD